MENKIDLSQPPNCKQQIFESNALYYRSKTDNEECIVLLQSHYPTNQRISKYQVQHDKFIPISPKSTRFDYRSRHSSASYAVFTNNTKMVPLKTPKLSHVISSNQSQLLTMINTKNQISTLDLNTYEYVDNYQLTQNDYIHKSHHKSYPYSFLTYTKKFVLLSVIFAIFWQNNFHSIAVGAMYSVPLYMLARYISNFAASFERDIKCVIPDFEDLYNVTTCSVDDDGIHFVANDCDNDFELKCFKFNIKTRLFEKLKPIQMYNTFAFPSSYNGDGDGAGDELRTFHNSQEQLYVDDGQTIVAPFKIVYIEALEALVLFTNTENIYYFDLKEEEAQWIMFEDIKLPKVPGPDYDLNICVACNGIVFLFYSNLSMDAKAENNMNLQRLASEESDSDTDGFDGDGLVYCLDLVFSGQLFQCDNNYEDLGINRYEHIICTNNGWAHFIGDGQGHKAKSYHFKINLVEEIPIALTIQHLQIYHSLIKQYILENNNRKKLSTDIEMIILDYFPMFL